MLFSYVQCRDFYVYVHKKPDGTPFYVGKGRGIRAYDKMGRNAAWCEIVSEIEDYEIEIARAGLLDEDARKLEAILIRKYGKISDGGTLTNSKEYDHSFEWRNFYVAENLEELHSAYRSMIDAEWPKMGIESFTEEDSMPAAPFSVSIENIIVDATGREVTHPVEGEWADDLSVASIVCDALNRAHGEATPN